MTQRGRPPHPGTAEEKAALRREKVRLYVKAHRERKKTAPASSSVDLPSNIPGSHPPPPLSTSTKHARASENGGLKRLKPPKESSTALQGKFDTRQPTPRGSDTKLRSRPSSPSIIYPAPQGNKEVAMALLERVRSQFLPSTVLIPATAGFGSELVTPCSPWFMKAYMLAMNQDTSALKSSLLAVGLSVVAAKNRDERLRLASFNLNRQALRQMRAGLQPLSEGSATNFLSLYLSCLAVSMFEMLHSGFSEEKIMPHLKGAASLMRYLPQDPSVDRLLHDLLLEDLCVWDLTFALKVRKSSPLAAIRRHRMAKIYRVAGTAGQFTANATLIGDLLDCADQIPSIMASVDAIKQSSHLLESHSRLETEAERLASIFLAFDIWAMQCQTRFGPAFLPADGSTEPYDLDVQFVSYEVGVAWTLFLLFRLCAIETNIDILDQSIQLSRVNDRSPTSHTKYSKATKLTVRSTHGHTSLPERGSAAHKSPTVNTPASREAIIATKARFPKIDALRQKLDKLRIELREFIPRLLRALCLLLPESTGTIASSLVIFPLGHIGGLLEKEIDRLQNELDGFKSSLSPKGTEILTEMGQMSRHLAVYETLKEAFLHCGIPFNS